MLVTRQHASWLAKALTHWTSITVNTVPIPPCHDTSTPWHVHMASRTLWPSTLMVSQHTHPPSTCFDFRLFIFRHVHTSTSPWSSTFIVHMSFHVTTRQHLDVPLWPRISMALHLQTIDHHPEGAHLTSLDDLLKAWLVSFLDRHHVAGTTQFACQDKFKMESNQSSPPTLAQWPSITVIVSQVLLGSFLDRRHVDGTTQFACQDKFKRISASHQPALTFFLSPLARSPPLDRRHVAGTTQFACQDKFKEDFSHTHHLTTTIWHIDLQSLSFPISTGLTSTFQTLRLQDNLDPCTWTTQYVLIWNGKLSPLQSYKLMICTNPHF
jgi:hypothetical protein